MFELTINGSVVPFNFGMGFLREINKTVTAPIEGVDIAKNIGLQYHVASLIDGDLESLVEVLFAGNKGQNPRVSKNDIDNYIDNEVEDIDELINQVIDFLSSANATKKTVVPIVGLAKAKK